MRVHPSATRYRSSSAIHFVLLLGVAAGGCQEGDGSAPAGPPPNDRTPAQATRADAALETLRANWDSEVITGAMVDEIKKVIDERAPDDIEPLLDRLELLERSGDAYAPDFVLWWDKRGRNELGGKLFGKRELLHQAVEMAMEGGGDEAKLMGIVREAAATGDPVARMWQTFAGEEMSGRHDGAAFDGVFAVIAEVRDLIDAGDADAAYFMGLFAMEGDMDLIGGSPEEVIGWLEMGAEAGIDHAAQLLSEAYRQGRHGIPRDLVKAALWEAKASGATSEELEPVERADKAITTSQNNMKQLGLVAKMFANESRGEVFPPLTSLRGHLAMDASVIYPEYISDVTVYISPAHPDYLNILNVAESDAPSVISDHSYWYLGYMLPDEAVGLAFIKHFKEEARAGRRLDANLDLESGTVYRLREGIERFLITDINDPRASASMQSTIPVMIERPGLHEGGASVLFMDGHVTFMEYPGEFPMTKAFIEALESLEEVRGRP